MSLCGDTNSWRPRPPIFHCPVLAAQAFDCMVLGSCSDCVHLCFPFHVLPTVFGGECFMTILPCCSRLCISKRCCIVASLYCQLSMVNWKNKDPGPLQQAVPT